MAHLEIYRERFAESGWEIFGRAMAEARRRGQNYIGTEHILYALIQEKAELFGSLLQSVAENPQMLDMLARLVDERLEASPKHEGEGIRLAPATVQLFKQTLGCVRSGRRQRMEATDLFIKLLMDEESLLRELLRTLLRDPMAGRKDVRDLFAVVESVGAASRPSPQQTYRFLAGEVVRIRRGPFANFQGRVAEVNEEVSTLSISIFILGREQPVEIKFFDVEKLKPE